ncbi:MAG: hypothetical protein QM606_02590 [Leucobacter sp.]
MNTTIRRTGAVLATAGLALGLMSCSGGQSVEEACTVAEETMNEVVTESQADIQQSLQDALQGNEVDFEATLKPIQDALAETQDKVTNKEVKSALDAFVDEYDAFAASIEEVDLSGFADLSEMADLELRHRLGIGRIEVGHL